jgi:large repetitive protein
MKKKVLFIVLAALFILPFAAVYAVNFEGSSLNAIANTACSDLGYDYEVKFEDFFQGDKIPESGSATIPPVTINNFEYKGEGDDKEVITFDWSSTIGIGAMIIKAKDSKVETFSPPAFSGSGTTIDNFGISHISFCWSDPPANPAIDIEKSTNGQDADAEPGPTLTVGASVTWTYVVTNTGDVPLSNVNVVDDQPDVTPTYMSGDDGDSVLQPGESWTFQAMGTAVAGQYTNLGTVTASYESSIVIDTDRSHYFGETPANPAIDIEKSTNGQDADAEPGPTLTVGETVTWTYIVTNTGDVPLSNIVVTDNQPDVTPAYVSGDDGDSVLQPGEAWTFQATGRVIEGQYSNLGTVTANHDSTQVTDSDTSHYFGETSKSAGISIEKSTNGQDADAEPGPTLTVGETVTWTYIVTNTGDVPLSNIVVTDNQPDVAPAYVSGDNGDSILEPGESWTFQATGTVIEGQYTNLGTVNANSDSSQVSDSDPSHYFGETPANPAIDIEKSTNGQDADAEPGPTLIVGETVTWTYIVTNTGDVPLSNIVVTDNQPDVTPAYVSGDNGDSVLEPGEAWTFQATGTVIEGQYSNLGTVTANYDSTQVTDSDMSHYFGEIPQINPSIQLIKEVFSVNGDPDKSVFMYPGDIITYTFTVTNTGDVTLVDVVVSDPLATVSGEPITLAPGESNRITFTATYSITSADLKAGYFTNTATVIGYAPNGESVTDQDSATVKQAKTY